MHSPNSNGDPARLDLPLVSTRLSLMIATTWDGEAVGDNERVALALEISAQELVVEVEAPFHDDPPPAGEVGSTDKLWEHEVVELMLLGDDARYLELELSPHGHYLALQLHGVRNVVHREQALSYRATIDRDARRWRGCALIPLSWLPNGCTRLNAFAVHGLSESRRYLAWRPTGGDRPDFHRLEVFEPIYDAIVDPAAS
jgi:hypothetical protein